MLQNVTLTPSRRTLEFGIYRDGDNNLDRVQESAVDDAFTVSRHDANIQFTVEDTTSSHLGYPGVHTDDFTIADGDIDGLTTGKTHDMSDEQNLAAFVARTLDNAEASGAKQTWIELVDHGGGDGGGLQTSDGTCMSMPDIAKAMADGVAMHAKEHPEDAGRTVDGVVANQCLMATMGFADALSHAGVRFLAASPETMIAPGVSSGVAHLIASNEDDPKAMAKAVVRDVMQAHGTSFFGPMHAAAAFDVLDLDPAKIAKAEDAIGLLNGDLGEFPPSAMRSALLEDVKSVEGMARIPGAGSLPWHADRSAIAVYDRIAKDTRIDSEIRADAHNARDAVAKLVLAHGESRDFAVFGDADYSDAVGPTIHAPTSRAQIDPWASHGISETNNAFYRRVDQSRFVRALA